ncbi:hypothetical protein B1810_12495 [Panacagrimonas perspica]|nr:hypothetical protein B1810_12495 [Panacagrimonas perspica]
MRDLRIAMTDAEQKLGYFLRDRRFGGLKFRRQHPVQPFVLDFFREQLKLGIELDGGQHNEDAMAVRGAKRSRVLNAKGIQVVRFWNDEMLGRIEEVLQILWELAFRGPDSPSPRLGLRGSAIDALPRWDPTASGHPLPVGEGKRGRSS